MKASRLCPWCPPDDVLYVRYHDEEWGVPEFDGLKLFALLNLEGAQAGLSWRTVLGKRKRYFEVFENFIPWKLAAWTPEQIEQALTDPGIIRNRLKVSGVVRNSRAFLTHFQKEPEAFSHFLWDFAGGRPQQNQFQKLGDFPSRTETSDAMSKALRRMDFTFVGSTICYAFMQAAGMVNDHVITCHRYRPVAKIGRTLPNRKFT